MIFTYYIEHHYLIILHWQVPIQIGKWRVLNDELSADKRRAGDE